MGMVSNGISASACARPNGHVKKALSRGIEVCREVFLYANSARETTG
jgi:hypothetical protein